MLKRKIYLFVLMLVAAMSGACTMDDMRRADRGDWDGEGERPVTFNISLPATRAIENPKKKFTNGDVIHIQGTFKLKYDGVEELQTEIRYGAMLFDGKKWTPLDGSKLKWPNAAVSGTFVAYFISGSTGVLYHEVNQETGEDYSRTRTYRLSDITPDGNNSDADSSWSDPLKAETDKEVEYGYAVGLEFHHLCAYLTLTDLEPAVSDRYWFSTPDSEEPLPNAFYLSLTEEDTLEFNIVSVPEAGYTVNNQDDGTALYCVSGEANTVDGQGTVANYFLFPAYYPRFVLSYPVSTPTFNSDGSVQSYGRTLSYMSYDYDQIPNDVGGMEVENVKPELEAGRTYVLSVTKSPGATITIPPEGGSWDESDDYTEVDPEEFFEHVTNGTGWVKDGTVILEEINGGTRLCRNVDFAGKFDYWDHFQPKLPAGLTFDGDYHYIRNAGGQLFHLNDGTIRNLGVRTINVDFVTFEDSGNKDDDMSRLGALCMYNHTTGVIENIRMEDVSVTAHIKTYDEDESPEVHNIGCILGSNAGRMSQVALSGTLTLTVEKNGESGDFMDATVNIGGIVGQNAGKARIEDVSSLNGTLKVEIYNKCYGPKAAFYVGGIVGQNSGYIGDVILPDVTVDGSVSTGNGSYMGGMAGEMVVSAEDSDSRLSSCIVSGSVKAGTVVHTSDAASGLYTGGIAGAVNGLPVEDCRSAVSVEVPTATAEEVTCATGGAFGRIRIQTDMSDIIAYGSRLSGPAHIGNFAGIVPEGESWETYSGKNIVVRRFNSINDIGASISQ